MGNDTFSEHGKSLTGPATKIFKAIFDDQAEQYEYCRAFMVNTDGDVSITTLSDDDVIVPNCVAGYIYPIRCKKFKVTGTTVEEVLCLV